MYRSDHRTSSTLSTTEKTSLSWQATRFAEQRPIGPHDGKATSAKLFLRAEQRGLNTIMITHLPHNKSNIKLFKEPCANGFFPRTHLLTAIHFSISPMIAKPKEVQPSNIYKKEEGMPTPPRVGRAARTTNLPSKVTTHNTHCLLACSTNKLTTPTGLDEVGPQRNKSI